MAYYEPSMYIFYIYLNFILSRKESKKALENQKKNPLIYNPSPLMNIRMEKSIWLYN